MLLALADGPKHGYLILKDVEERTGGEVRLSTGTLYGLIKRFLDDELIVETASRRRWPRAAPALQAHRRSAARWRAPKRCAWNKWSRPRAA